ncbi:MAG: DUF881 domain-containing protein [Angustibacter sp.]
MDADETDVQPLPSAARSSGQLWARLRSAARPRPTRSQLLAAILVGGLGFALVTQVTRDQREPLAGMRQSELVQYLADLTNRRDRLARERAELEEQQRELNSGAAGSESAIAAAKSRLDSLGVLAGTVPAEGPGVIVTLTGPESSITAVQLLGVVQELRDAGAETMQIGSARVVVSTAISTVNGRVAVDGIPQSSPIVVTAIGDGSTMATALQIPGGVIATLREPVTGTTKIAEKVKITALRPVPRPRFAKPVP